LLTVIPETEATHALRPHVSLTPKQARWTIAVATTFLGMTSFQVGARAQQDAPPASCHVTLPSSVSGVPSSSVPIIAFGIGKDGSVEDPRALILRQTNGRTEFTVVGWPPAASDP
jgi:hypothetical protein